MSKSALDNPSEMRSLVPLLLLSAATLQAQTSRHELRGDRVAIYNLVGELRVEGGSGDEVRVEVLRSGRDSDRLRVESGRIEGRETLRVVYPGNRITAPGFDRGGDRGNRSWRLRTQLRVGDDGTFGGGWDSDGRRVEITSDGGGLEAAADLRVTVPGGKRVELHLAVGTATVRNVDGDISVDVHAATIESNGTRGKLTLDTGSGNVTVRDASGEVTLDTGSGDVSVEGVRGPFLRMDTGSGAMTVRRVQVDELRLDSGSGRVVLRDVQAPDLQVDTGSGSVEIDLTSDVERMTVDTGSGGITIGVPRSLGAQLDVETGSGSIDIDVPASLTRSGRRHITGSLGDGRGRMTVETGSGGVRIREVSGAESSDGAANPRRRPSR